MDGRGTYIPPRIHKFLPDSGAPESALQAIIDFIPKNLYTPNTDGNAIHALEDFKKLPITVSNITPSVSVPSFIQILHTPGHTADSIVVYMPLDRALYTADTVLGQGTAVFEDLASLITSLSKMRDFKGYTKVFPGHGPTVDDGPTLINAYIEHRMKREEEIMQILCSDERGSNGTWTIWSIVSKIYAAYPESLWLPAARSVELHLKKLEKDKKVKHVGGDGTDGQWELINL